MYQKKNKGFSIKQKNEIVLLYLDGHMGRTEILRTYGIANDSIFHRWVEQYRQFGTCVDNRGKCTKLKNPNKGQGRRIHKKKTYQEMSKEELIKELEFRDELKNFLVYLNQQNKNT